MERWLGNLRQLDLWLFLHGNTVWVRPWADAVFLWLTAPPHRVLLLAGLWLLLFAFGGRKGRIAAVVLLVAVALSDQLCNRWIKVWADRVRPCFVIPETRLLLPHQARSPSFPSSHAMNTFAAAMVLFEVGPLLGWTGLAVAALVSWSRVYVGVHYPSDVLAGAVFGVLVGLAIVRLERRLLQSAWAKRRFSRGKSEDSSRSP